MGPRFGGQALPDSTAAVLGLFPASGTRAQHQWNDDGRYPALFFFHGSYNSIMSLLAPLRNFKYNLVMPLSPSLLEAL